MTIWKLTKRKNTINISRTNDGGKTYSLGDTVSNVRQALSSIVLWVQPNDIIDSTGISEVIKFKNKQHTWNHTSILMAKNQGLPRN